MATAGNGWLSFPKYPIPFFPISSAATGAFPLLGRLARVLGLSADYILFGTEQVTDISAITDMLSGLDGKYLPELKELLSAYLKTITIAEKQDD